MQDKPPKAAIAAQPDEVVLPVVIEELSVETTRVARGAVRLQSRVETREETVDLPTEHEEVIVDRVPVDRIIEGEAPVPRDENGVFVIPVVEEVTMIEKPLILREEIRITRRRTTTSRAETVTLRRQVVDVERVDADASSTEAPKNRT